MLPVNLVILFPGTLWCYAVMRRGFRGLFMTDEHLIEYLSYALGILIYKGLDQGYNMPSPISGFV